MASTYHDEIGSSEAGSFRYWFICKCNFGYGQSCNALITSKAWQRKYAPGSKRNGWKCTICSGNYSTNWGCLVEVVEVLPDGSRVLSYMVADIPDPTFLDIKAKEIEETVAKRARTADEVFDSIPTFAPTASSLVGVVDEETGQYKILDEAVFKTLPKWTWADILTLGMKMAEGKAMADALDEMHGIESV